MKITIEPTEENVSREFAHSSVSISKPYDDVTVSDMCEMFRDAMLAMGFNAETIKEFIDLEY
jgi:hypothetical protein